MPYYYGPKGDFNGSNSPVVLDPVLLFESGGDLLDRAHELKNQFHEWLGRQEDSFARSTMLREYLARYGRFTPIVLLPLPPISEERFRSLAERKRLTESLATGRFLTFDVRSDELEPSGPTGWKRELFGDRFIAGGVNDSPVDPKRFEGVLIRSKKLLRRLLRNWIDRLGDIDSEEERSGPPRIGVPGPYAFVSYSRRNADAVYPICDHLAAHGVSLWIDQTSIIGGEEFLSRLVDGISGCQQVLPFCSPDFCRLKWCEREVLFAINEKKKLLPAWLKKPALSRGMKLMLGIYQAVRIDGLSPPEAAKALYDHLNGGGPTSQPAAQKRRKSRAKVKA